MEKAFLILWIAALSGCVSTNPVVPELAGKPRIKINEQAQTSTVEPPLTTAPTETPAPDHNDIKGSNKHVRKKIKGGSANR